jgi:hypothetical protein
VIRGISLFTIIVVLLIGWHSAFPQTSATKLRASDGAAVDYFGWSVVVSDDFAIAGSYSDDNVGTDAGAAYIFHYDGTDWVQQAKLIASDAANQDYFGYSVCLAGDNAIVGAYLDDDNGNSAGAAYIFHYNGTAWTEQSKLTASDGGNQDQFGRSVSLSGDYALVAAYKDDTHAPDVGAVYAFHFDGQNWVEQGKLVASDGTAFDNFGRSVSLSGEYALIGASGDDESGTTPGFAYIFRFNGLNWIEEVKLTASDGLPGDRFGQSVSLDGDIALVGAVGDDDNGETAGAAYIFQRVGTIWIEQSKLKPGDGAAFDNFGRSVSLSGDYALLGAGGDDDSGPYSGSAYLFRSDGSNWTEETKLIASDGAAVDHFGGSVSLSEDHILIGAYGDDSWTGSAYVYRTGPACEDFNQFQARCRPGGVIKARVIMADASHAGDIVEISIDGVPYEVTIDASGRAQLSQGGFGSGPHNVELTYPPRCFDPVVVTCRSSDVSEGEEWDNEENTASLRSTPDIDLIGNYPNPFNPSTEISYVVGENTWVTLKIFTMLGEEVTTLVNEYKNQGSHSVQWSGRNEDGSPASSGLYMYRLSAAGAVQTGKMMLTK